MSQVAKSASAFVRAFLAILGLDLEDMVVRMVRPLALQPSRNPSGHNHSLTSNLDQHARRDILGGLAFALAITACARSSGGHSYYSELYSHSGFLTQRAWASSGAASSCRIGPRRAFFAIRGPFVHFCTFAAERNRMFLSLGLQGEELRTVSHIRFHARQAAVALLKMAKATSDPRIAAGLLDAAADLKDQVGELPPPISVRPPDVQTEE
jgi:hypothetical protein